MRFVGLFCFGMECGQCCVFSSNCCFATKAISVISHLACFTVPWHACWWQHFDLQNDVPKTPGKKSATRHGFKKCLHVPPFWTVQIAQTKSNQVQCRNMFSLKQINAQLLVQTSSFALNGFFDHITFWCRSYHQFKHPGYLEHGSLQSLFWIVHVIMWCAVQVVWNP